MSFANDHGRKITLENCPMLFSYDEWPGGHNIATSPRMWRRILETWGDTIGLNFDPSHLVLQMIDVRRFLKEFGPHILHFQAKDLQIDRDGLYERGIFSMGIGWQIRDGVIQARGDDAFEKVVSTAKDALQAADKTTAHNELLEALKEEMFQLESERAQGRVSQQEYNAAKYALDKTLQRVVKRKKTEAKAS